MQADRVPVSARVGGFVALGALVALVACGGGGGSAAPAPAPEPPSSGLSITASATQTTAGGSTVDLTATLQNSSNPVLWSLAGPGTLSAATGSSVRYTPPASADLLVSRSTTVTASSREHVRSITIQLSPAPGAPPPVPGTRWEIAQYPKYWFTDLRLLNGRFFVTTAIGGILSSTDGINWTPANTPIGRLLAVTHGNGRYMAVGINTVFRSDDGDTWTRTAATGDFEFHDVAAGNGAHVAIGPYGLSHSVDGVTWARVGPTDIGRGAAVVFGGGRFVAVGNTHRIHHSDDGVQWSSQPLPDVTTLRAVAYGNGRFVLIGAERHFVSTDGVTWTATPAGSHQGYRLRFASGQFFLIDADVVKASADGLTWREVHRDSSVYNLVGMAESAGRFVVAEDSGLLQHRSEGSALSAALPGLQAAVRGMVAADGQFLAVTDQGDVLRSADARVWNVVGSRLPAMFRGLSRANGLFVAVSEGGPQALYTSPDGNQWSGITLGSTISRLSSVTHGNGMFVAVGGAGEIFYSPDGVNWTRATSPVTVELTSVAHGNGRFVAVSVQGHFVVSADGVSWVLQHNENGRLRGVAYGANGFLAVGDAYGSGGGGIWASADGLVWTPRQTGLIQSLHAVTYGNGQYLVAGSDGALLLSGDGSSWQARSAGIHAGYHAVCAADGRFIAAGWGGAIVLSVQ